MCDEGDYSLISKDTPLISNLNMIENIALIKEVHEFLNTKDAQEIADEYLSKIDLSNIALNRIEQCTQLETFYVMFIRALMSKRKNIIIIKPFSLINNLINIHTISDVINKINNEKNIFSFDSVSNEMHYKGYPCLTIK
jgi:ABC-type lipoprotein export system ATPase subunit